MTFKTNDKTSIREFLLDWYPTTDVQPVGQRLNTTTILVGKSKPSKAQGIISAIFSGINLGQITMCKSQIKGFNWESIDGGHRKRYIKGFFENGFPTFGDNPKYFRDLSAQKKKEFLDYPLSLCLYEELDTWRKGYIFRTINETTDVNHQEELNSYGNVPIANHIREIVRIVQGINNKPNTLFISSKTNGEEFFTNLGFNNSRLRIDEIVARFYFQVWAGYGSASDKNLERMYQDETITEEVAIKLTKKVTKLLTFLEDMAYAKKTQIKNGLAWKEFVILSRIWFYMEETYKSYSIKDNKEFYLDFKRAFDKYAGPKPIGKYNKLTALAFDPIGRTVAEAFRGYCGEWVNVKKIKQSVRWILEDFDILSHTVLKDPRRAFPNSWKESKLTEQNFICVVDGKPLNLDNSVMAHIKAHSEGGMTVWENLAVTSIEHNSKMGSMSVYNYKELLFA